MLNKLSEADKFDLQQYVTRCYGSLTTFVHDEKFRAFLELERVTRESSRSVMPNDSA